MLKELLERSFLKHPKVKTEEIDEEEFQLLLLKWSRLLTNLIDEICPIQDEIVGTSIKESTKNDEKVIEYVAVLTKRIKHLRTSIETIKTAVEQGIAINDDKHILTIDSLNLAIHSARFAQSNLKKEEFNEYKNVLNGILVDFDRIYRKYIDVLRLYDIKNRTNVLKPEKFSL
jgi:hypothetical protein